MTNYIIDVTQIRGLSDYIAGGNYVAEDSYGFINISGVHFGSGWGDFYRQTVSSNPAYGGSTAYVLELSGQGLIIDGCLNVSGISMNSSMTGFSGLVLDNSDGKNGFIQWGATLATTARLAQVVLSGHSEQVLAVQAWVGTGGKFNSGVWDLGALDVSLLFVDHIVPATGGTYPNNIVYFFGDIALWGPSTGHKLYDSANSAGSDNYVLTIDASTHLPTWKAATSGSSWNGGTVTNATTFSNALVVDRTATSGAIWFCGATDINHVLWNDYQHGPTTRSSGGWDGMKWNTYNGLQIFTGTSGATARLIIDGPNNTISFPNGAVSISGSLTVGAGVHLNSTGTDNFQLFTQTNNPNPNWSIGYGNGSGATDTSKEYISSNAGTITINNANLTVTGNTFYLGPSGSGVALQMLGGSWLTLTNSAYTGKGGLAAYCISLDNYLYVGDYLTVAGAVTFQKTGANALSVYGQATFNDQVNLASQLNFNLNSGNYACLYWSNRYTITLGANSNDLGLPYTFAYNGATYYFGALDVGAVYTEFLQPLNTHIYVGGVLAGYSGAKVQVSGGIHAYGGDLDLLDGGTSDSTAVRIISDSGNLYLQHGSGGKTIFRGTTGNNLAVLWATGAWDFSNCGIAANGAFSTVSSITSGSLTGSGTRAVYSTSGGTLTNTSSSRRYKENIRDLSDCSWIFALKPVMFDWIDNRDENNQIGLIAEDVYAVNPVLAFTDKNGVPEGVHYERLGIPLLVEVQKLRSEVDDLRRQLKVLNDKSMV